MILDWTASIIGLIGAYLIGQKKKSGFILGIISALIWCIVGVITGLYGLVLSGAPFLIVYVLNYIKWTKEPPK